MRVTQPAGAEPIVPGFDRIARQGFAMRNCADAL